MQGATCPRAKPIGTSASFFGAACPRQSAQPRGFPGVRLSFEEAEGSLDAVADRLAMPRGWAAGTSSMFWRSPAEPRAGVYGAGALVALAQIKELVPLTRHLRPVLAADALARRNAGIAAAQGVVGGRFQVAPCAPIPNFGEGMVVLRFLPITAELQPHLSDDLLDARVQPQLPAPATSAARQQAGKRAVIAETLTVPVELSPAGPEIGGGFHGRAVETIASFQTHDDLAPTLGFSDLRLAH